MRGKVDPHVENQVLRRLILQNDCLIQSSVKDTYQHGSVKSQLNLHKIINFIFDIKSTFVFSSVTPISSSSCDRRAVWRVCQMEREELEGEGVL